MTTPLYTTDVIPPTSRPTLTVMDDGDYFLIFDMSTAKISKILRTDAQKALNISYDNTTSGLTATQVQAALDELVVNLGSSDSAISALAGRLDTLEGTGAGSVVKAIDDAVEVVTDQAVKTTSTPSFIGVKFPATQVPSADPNTLDDYEEGTWTPTLAGTTVDGVQTYNEQIGHYTKVGNKVFIQVTLSFSTVDPSAIGYARITGLPFVTKNITNFTASIFMSLYGRLSLGAGYTQLGIRILPNESFLIPYQSGSGIAARLVDIHDIADNGYFSFAGEYIAN